MIPKLEEAFGEVSRSYTTPIDPDYHPELDELDLCAAKEGSLYGMAIGYLQMDSELGRHRHPVHHYYLVEVWNVSKRASSSSC